MLYLTCSHVHKSILLLDLLSFYTVLPPFDKWSNAIVFLLNISSFYLCYWDCCSFRLTRSKLLYPHLDSTLSMFLTVLQCNSSGYKKTVSVVLDNFLLFAIQLLLWRCLSQSITSLQWLTSNVLDFYFLLTSIFSNASFSSAHLRYGFPMIMSCVCFVSPINRSNWPHHHGALDRLNFHVIFSLLKKLWNLSSLFWSAT